MIRYSDRATKDLSKLPAGLRQKAESVLQQLDSNPIIGTKLKGKLQGLHVTADGSLDLALDPTYQQDGVEGYKNQTRAKLAEIRKELGLS